MRLHSFSRGHVSQNMPGLVPAVRVPAVRGPLLEAQDSSSMLDLSMENLGPSMCSEHLTESNHLER